MTTSQAILSLSPTSCHVFIALIEQNLSHNRFISGMILSWVGKCLRPCMSVCTRCYKKPARRRLQKQGLLWKGFAPAEESQKDAGNERPLLCGVVCSVRGLRHPCAVGQVRELGERRCSNTILAKGGGWDAVAAADTELQGQELDGDRWKCLAKWFACVRDR